MASTCCPAKKPSPPGRSGANDGLRHHCGRRARHEGRAFAGALADKKGLLEEASGGTIFLDEIGEEFNVQAKFLRVLEMRQFTKLGDTRPTSINICIVAATNRNLRQEAEAGNFRPGLYYRLAVFTVLVPGLNERRDDVPELANYFLQFFAVKLRHRLHGLGPDVLVQLRAHNWCGNVRELKNVLERAAILADGDTLTLDDLPPEFHRILPAPSHDEATDRTLRTQKKHQIRQVLLDTGGNKMEAAHQLANMVTYATATVQPQLADKQLHLDLQLPATLPEARADVEKTTWVLLNLLANAIRYSPVGGTVRAARAVAFV